MSPRASVTPQPATSEPAEPDGTDLDTLADHALAALATRFATASGVVQELFDDYTRQAQAILSAAQDTGKTPDIATGDEPSTSS